MDHSRIENAVREILAAVGEDPKREGLLDTPARIARMYEEVLAGQRDDPARHLSVQFYESHTETSSSLRSRNVARSRTKSSSIRATFRRPTTIWRFIGGLKKNSRPTV